jgi:hypothetical protein
MSKDTNVVQVKLVILRVLKVVSYLLGLPLILYIIRQDAKAIQYGILGDTAMSAYNLIFYAVLGVIVLQFIIGFLLHKRNFYVRALIVAILATAVVIVPLIYTEYSIKAEFEGLQEKYADSGYYFERYPKQVGDYDWRLSENEKALKQFIETYHLSEEENGETKGGNFDRTPTSNDLEESTIFNDGFGSLNHYFFGEEDIEIGDLTIAAAPGATYSMNGLYADSYIFGVEQARYILQVYNAVESKYAMAGKEADAELLKALQKVENSTTWKNYKNTYEYKRAYSDEPIRSKPLVDPESGGAHPDKIEIGNASGRYDEYWMHAEHYYLTEAEVRVVVGVLIDKIKTSKGLEEIMKLLSPFIGLLGLPGNVENIIKDYKNLNLDKLLEAVNSIESIGTLLVDLGLADSADAVVDMDLIMDLIAGYSFYQSPTTYPQMFFIDDDELRAYAYAKYYGMQHGSFIGSVLIGSSVGEVTLSNGGSTPISADDLNYLFKRLEIESEYMPKYYPWLALREGLLKYGGLAPVAIVLSYLFAYFERKQFSKLTLAKTGGNR